MVVQAFFLGGFNNYIFTRATRQMGLIEHLAKTASPSLKAAFVFGAVHGSINHCITEWKEKQIEHLDEASYLKKSVNLAHKATMIILSYGVARICNRFFGTNITTNYLHFLNASSLILKLDKHSTFLILVLSQISSKIISQVRVIPTTKNAFYFRMITLLGQGVILANCLKLHSKVKEKTGLKDSRALGLFHMAYGCMALAMGYFSEKICNKYFKLNIPTNVVSAQITSQIPVFLFLSFYLHFTYDIDWNQVTKDIKNSKDQQGHEILMRINKICSAFSELNVYRDGLLNAYNNFDLDFERRVNLVNLGPLWETIRDGSFFISWMSIGGGFLLQILREFNRYFGAYLKGEPIEEKLAQSFKKFVSSNKESAESLLDSYEKLLGEHILNRAKFIEEEILKDASEETRRVFRYRENFTLGFTKEEKENCYVISLCIPIQAICMYVVDKNYKNKRIPLFFSKQVREEIQKIRDQIQKDITVGSRHEKILESLRVAFKANSEELKLLAFLDNLEEKTKAIFNALRNISYSESRGWSGSFKRIERREKNILDKAEFIEKKILKDVSRETIDIFRFREANSLKDLSIEGENRDDISLCIAIQVICMYVVDENYKDRMIPLFFSKQNRKEIQKIRDQIQRNATLASRYEEIFKSLRAAFNANAKQQKFLAFADNLKGRTKNIFNILKKVGYSELKTEHWSDSFKHVERKVGHILNGAKFIEEKILKDVSRETIEIFKSRGTASDFSENPSIEEENRDDISLCIAIQAICIYVVDENYKDAKIPSFLFGYTRQKIRKIRSQIQEDATLGSRYETILKSLRKTFKGNSKTQKFLAFEGGLEEETKKILNTLKQIRSYELQTEHWNDYLMHVTKV